MSKAPQVFISYRKATFINAQGKQERRTPSFVSDLGQFLRASGKFDMFLDIERIPGGVEWERNILAEIYETDVMLVTVYASADPDIDTGRSKWVRREIALAKEDHTAILPLILPGSDPEQIPRTLKALGIDHIQHQAYPQDEADWARLEQTLARLVHQTREEQSRRVHRWQARWYAEPLNVPTYQPRFAFCSAGGGLCRVLLGTGDMVRARGIDVLVNSENDYMQMARHFESWTLSSRLRTDGARVDDNGAMLHDALQIELDQQVAAMFGKRPVGLGSVIPTHAGHRRSVLAERGTRYVLHAAAVSFQPNHKDVPQIMPMSKGALPELVERCLRTTQRIDSTHGLPHLSGWDDVEGAYYRPIQSILLPVFGTGQANAGFYESILQVARGVQRFLEGHEAQTGFALREIHLAIYKEADLIEAKRVFGELFTPCG